MCKIFAVFLILLITAVTGCTGFKRVGNLMWIGTTLDDRKEIANSSNHLRLKFKDFGELNLKSEVIIRKRIASENQASLICSPIIYKIFKFSGILSEIELTLDRSEYCASLKLSYRTFRPFQRNEFASVNAEFKNIIDFPEGTHGSDYCKLDVNKESSIFQCPILNPDSRDIIIVMTNLSQTRTDELSVGLVWLVTINLLTRSSTIPFAILPTFLFGYTIERKDISIEVMLQ